MKTLSLLAVAVLCSLFAVVAWAAAPGRTFTTNTHPVGTGPLISVADVNGDGRLDLITGNYNTNTLTVLTNNGLGDFGFYATLNVGKSPGSVLAVDVNGDGKLDLISGDYGSSTMTVLTNNGTGVFGFKAKNDGAIIRQPRH